jgi:hypothetical protein
MAEKPANKTTSPRVASHAGGTLRDPKPTARERQLAGSDLRQAKPKPAPKPAAKPAPKPAAKPVPKPAAKPAPKPAAKPAPKLAAKKK